MFAQNNNANTGYADTTTAPPPGYANYGTPQPQYAPGGRYDGNPAQSYIGHFAQIMSGVFGYMFAGLIITAVAAMVAMTNTSFMVNLVESGMYWGLVVAELVLVFTISLAINKLSSAAALFIFLAYSALNGLTLSFILLAYSGASVAGAFLSTALMFGAMAVIGGTTKKDLTTMGGFLIMGLVGIIIASIVNFLILDSSMLDFGITVVGLLIFIGLTAYDTQKIKANLQAATTAEGANKVTVIGALALYLDFINIFLRLLRLFGRK
jgi:FtsH-binding integral membrane protein